ncbi:hypothetical protein EII34_04315 [Arachnia propionica]|uniref:Uncharacterized protein n=1 Tax=Arachnia propionica TaxID=1750 RepID=A0A3P1TA71_9ACTN|nr:hypothetical protein [Arachnia propionica]MDO5084533.1 hypothetical protein [Arachnia propionica]RRD06342.1 hypothetical protein EII34_04315 [Arachnia propionica]
MTGFHAALATLAPFPSEASRKEDEAYRLVYRRWTSTGPLGSREYTVEGNRVRLVEVDSADRVVQDKVRLLSSTEQDRASRLAEETLRDIRDRGEEDPSACELAIIRDFSDPAEGHYLRSGDAAESSLVRLERILRGEPLAS